VTACALALALPLGACTTADDARVLQVLNQRGFGRPTQDANRQYYIGIGDGVALRDPDHKEYSGQVEKVRMDGTVTLADVGEVYINGLTPSEATQAIRQRYDRFLVDTSGMILQVTSTSSKKYYVTGAPPRKPGLSGWMPACRAFAFNARCMIVKCEVSMPPSRA